MTKIYKVSYKTYLNDRLKQVYFHGKLTHPLYVQVTFDRKTIFFKSYYFELFSKPRYFLSVAGLSGGPTIDDIIKKENEVIDFIIDKNQQDFSLDLFKKEYAYYSKDLCDITEEGFIDYMYIFLQDEGMPDLSVAVREGSKFRIVYDVVRDMKRAFNKPLYDKLIENSFYYAPPYLPLYGFMQQTKKWPTLSLTVKEWEDTQTKGLFIEYMQKYYPDKNAGEVMKEIDKWLAKIRKQGE